MHLQRWITALLALPLLIALIIKGGPTLFNPFVSAVAVVTLWEYYRIVFAEHSPKVPFFYSLWGYLFAAAIPVTVAHSGFNAVAALLVLCFLGAAAMSIFRFAKTQDAPIVALKQFFGIIYIPFLLSFAVLLYNDPDGVHWIILLMLVVVGSDTGAYYAGRTMGKHKLCPAVSPKKTVEGAIGGLVAAMLLSAVYSVLFLNKVSLPAAICLALVVGAVGQAGDLFESEFKRAAGVKDSSGLLPGHGGFLDRIDALLFAAPAAYLFKEYLLS